MKKIILSIAMLLAASAVTLAQQNPFNQHFILNNYFVNPAAAGATGNSNMYVNFRKQWMGIDGAPETQTLLGDWSVKEDKVGLGFMVQNDIDNVLGRLNAYATYSYKVRINDNQKFSFGISGGVLSSHIIQSNVRAINPDEAILMTDNRTATAFDANVGVQYYNRGFQAGFAAYHFLSPQMHFDNSNAQAKLVSTVIPQYIFNASYQLNFKSKDWSMTPLVLVRSAQGLPLQVDGGLSFLFSKKVLFNAMYRHANSVSASFGLLMNSYTIAYSYEYATTEIQTQSSGSHEITLGFRFGNGAAAVGPTKEVKALQKQNAELFEKTDMLKQQNDALKKQVEEQQKQLKEQIYNLEQIKQDFEQNKKRYEQIKQTKSDTTDALPQNNLPEGTERAEVTPTPFKLVVGMQQDLETAKLYQRILKREYNLDTRVHYIDSENVFVVVANESTNYEQITNEISTLQAKDTKSILTQQPWIMAQK